MRVDTLAEKWYVDFRVGHWNGALAQNKPGYVTLTPLVRPDVARTFFELSERARSAHRLHYEVMRRVAPDLLRVPLMNDVWDPDNRRAAGGGVPAEPFPTMLRPTHRTLGSWQYRFVEEQAAEIRSLLDRARRETELDAICDVARLQVAAETAADVSRAAVREVVSAIGVAILLLGMAERVVDHVVCEPA